MERIKVGYLPLYIKLYDDSNPAKREPMVRYMELLIRMLEAEGLEVIAAPVCRIASEFEAAVKMFREAGAVAIVTQHLAYSPSLESIGALKGAGLPIIVLDTTPDYSLVDRAATYSGVSVNHGIHGVQDMCNLLRRNGVYYAICAGHAMHSPVISQVAGMCRAARAAWAYRHARVGSVGGAFTGMGDFMISDEDYRDRIGAEVVYMDSETVQSFLEQVREDEVDAEMALDRELFDVRVAGGESHRAAVRSGLAVRKWAEAEKLSALTVNFLTLDICGLPKMPFAECCKAMVRGLGYAGEGDVLTAGMVGALRSVWRETSFVEIFCPDWKEDVILLSHMGEANLELAQWKPSLADMPFNYNTCGDTVAPKMCYRPGSAVFVNVAPAREGFSMIVTPVEMLDCGLPDGAYKNSIQGWMKPSRPLPEFLRTYSELGGTHHSALVYGAQIDEIEAFGRMMGFETHRL